MRLREMMERIAHGADLDRLTHETASQLDTLLAGAR
jgi:hypothetical protein